jgi:hypothetical protein
MGSVGVTGGGRFLIVGPHDATESMAVRVRSINGFITYVSAQQRSGDRSVS